MKFFKPSRGREKVEEIIDAADARVLLSVNTGDYANAAKIYREIYEVASKIDKGKKSSELLVKAAKMMLIRAFEQLGANDKNAAQSFFT